MRMRMRLRTRLILYITDVLLVHDLTLRRLIIGKFVDYSAHVAVRTIYTGRVDPELDSVWQIVLEFPEFCETADFPAEIKTLQEMINLLDFQHESEIYLRRQNGRI